MREAQPSNPLTPTPPPPGRPPEAEPAAWCDPTPGPSAPDQDARTRLVQKDRILVEARMLPSDRPLTPSEVEAVRQKLREVIVDDQGNQVVSFAQIAAEIDYSPSTLNLWFHNRYEGKVERVTHAINLWIERHHRRQQSQGERAYVETWVCEEMKAMVNLADRHQKMAVIVAPSGSGKDMVIDVLCEQLNGYKVDCNKQTTPRKLLLKLAEALGLPHRYGGASDLEDRIVKRLKDKSAILFLNEAQQLRPECASTIRYLFDQTAVPICLFGSAEVFAFIDDRASGGGQFWRRCLKMNVLRRAAVSADPDRPGTVGRKLYSRAEIRQYLAMKQVRLADDATFEMLHQIACLPEHGTLGLLEVIVGMAKDLYGEEPVRREHLLQVMGLVLDTEADAIVAKLQTRRVRPPAMAAAAG